MRPVTRYIADDGSEHETETKARERDELVKQVAAIMAPLGRVNDTTLGFDNGGGYAKHDPAVVLQARNTLCELAYKISPHRWFLETIEKGFTAHASWAGRLLDDIGGPVEVAWRRIRCIGHDGKEYGQPYFVEHPDEVKDFEFKVIR